MHLRSHPVATFVDDKYSSRTDIFVEINNPNPKNAKKRLSNIPPTMYPYHIDTMIYLDNAHNHPRN